VIATRAAQLKFEVYDHPLTCPYCKISLVFTSTLKVVSLLHKDCPKCGKEFVIQDGVAPP
jgi:transposase-like protein